MLQQNKEAGQSEWSNFTNSKK